MSYAGPVIRLGVERFLARIREAGASGCIIPDLPVGSDEGLYAAAASMNLHAVPVIAPNITPRRLEQILSIRPTYIYTALRAGITGSQTKLTPALISFLDTLRNRGTRVLGGFGISSSAQVRELAPHLHASVVGSHLVRIIQKQSRNRDLKQNQDLKSDLYRNQKPDLNSDPSLQNESQKEGAALYRALLSAVMELTGKRDELH